MSSQLYFPQRSTKVDFKPYESIVLIDQLFVRINYKEIIWFNISLEEKNIVAWQ